jgi:hypothetical protein
MKLLRPTETCLNNTYKVHIGKNLSDSFPILNGLKGGDALLPLLSNSTLHYATRKVQENQEGPELNGAPQPLVYANTVKILGEDINIIKKNKEVL